MIETKAHIVIQEGGVLIPNELFGQDAQIIEELKRTGVLTEMQNGSAQPSKNSGRELKPVRRVPPIDLSREFQWLNEHKYEYVGKWVAVEGDQLISVGATGKEVYAAARAAGIKSPFVEYISPIDDLPFGGW